MILDDRRSRVRSLFVTCGWLKLKIDRPIYFKFIQFFINRLLVISLLWKKSRLRNMYHLGFLLAIIFAIYPLVHTLWGRFPLLPAALARIVEGAGAHALAP